MRALQEPHHPKLTFHDGRCLTLEDTVEFFNLVLELQLTSQDKQDLVNFMRQLQVCVLREIARMSTA
jgi:hypothetical protein